MGLDAMKMLFLIIALSLVGCASHSEIRSKGAAFSVTSIKNAKEVTACVADKWENAPFFSKFTGTINTGMAKNGFSVTAYGKNAFGTWPMLIAQIDETATGSVTAYYTTKPLAAESYYKEAVNNCQ
jgi:hypothetical protein